MDIHVEFVALEVEDRNVVRLQAGLTVADIHSGAVEYVVAVGLDYDLLAGCGEIAEQASERALRPGVEVDFGLLEQEHLGGVLAQKFGEDRQSLADAVAHVNQVSLGAFESLAEFPYLRLKRGTRRFTEGQNGYFIEQAGVAAKVF